MKILTLLALASLLSCRPARAAQAINLDLDRDGKPDTVAIVISGESATLTVTLSASGRQLVFPGVLAKLFNGECNQATLAKLSVVGAGSFSIDSGYAGGDECTSPNDRAVISLGASGLVVDSLDASDWNFTHQGEISYRSTLYSADFVSKTLTETFDPKLKPRKEPLKPGCAPSLADLDQDGVPACVAMQRAWMHWESQPELGPACPRIEGNYECLRDGDPKPYFNRYVINRELNKVPVYDLSGMASQLVTDGKTHEYNHELTSRYFAQSTCHRETLHAVFTEFLTIGKSDPRKKWFDKLPRYRNEVTWTQQDVDGKVFREVHDDYMLDDDKNDGSYMRRSDEYAYTCTKIEM